MKLDRTALPLVLLVASLTLAGCTAAPSTGEASSPGSDASASAEPEEMSAEGCPPEMDAAASAGLDFVRVAPADYIIPGIDADLLATACLFEFTTGGKSGQWAWFPGASAADITTPLLAAGYALTDTSDTSERYQPASGVSMTVFAVGTAEQAAALGGAAVFDLIGPYVAVFQDFS
jgi:hypothetical protein